MKTMKYFLSMAALALVGAMTVSCSSDDNIIEQPQQPETKNNLVTLTTTVSLDGGDATRALSSTGVKTFAAGETMALIYKNKSGNTVKAVSEPLPAGDYGKSATFTFTLENPDKDQNVRYIYPAAMAGATDVDWNKLNTQNGTLSTLSSNLDLATFSAAWNGNNLPAVTLANQLAILAITLKNEAGSSDITSSTTELTVSDGTNTYNVSRSAVEGPIYVAIRPTASATIDITATSDGKGYYKTLATTKTYEASKGYSVSWKMTQGVRVRLAGLTGDYTAQDGDVLTGTLGSNVKISIADGATVTLKDVNINGSGTWTSGNYAGITCAGDATITLEGTNTVKGFYIDNPGIYVPEDNTLIIQGSGSLEATGRVDGAGIGGGYEGNCGNITIRGGVVTAVSVEGNAAGIGTGYLGKCGDITISGGTVTATGGKWAAGIGCGGGNSECGNILISGGTVTATGGSDAAGIGGGYAGADCSNSCGDITITSGVIHVTATMGGSNEENSTGPESIGAGGYCNGEWDDELEEILSYGVIICGDVTIEDDSKVTQN